jgi:CheY-like chemotaxis protein
MFYAAGTGGRHVLKILVADDNSNVQKTVTLALEDLGVEVVAVNNGEAAVRKLSEVSPDLVLADIFMPVRNGYEVCEYVKKNPRFAHLPVVLLVGAFDPLDERESQRVRADGILKKPFVPPDPLITMVKTLLERVESERLVTAPVARAPQTARAQSSASVSAEEQPPAYTEAREEPAEFTMLPEPVTFADGERPVAFGALLDAPAAEPSMPAPETIHPVDDDQILTSQRDATLGEPVFWRDDSEETGDESEAPPESQVEAQVVPPVQSTEHSPTPTWGSLDEIQPQTHEEPLSETSDSLELVREEQEDTSPSIAESGAILLDPAAQSPLTVQSGQAPDLAANPLEWMATAPVKPPEAAPEVAPDETEPLPEAATVVEASADAVVPVPDTNSLATAPVPPEVLPASSTSSEAPADLKSSEAVPEQTTTLPDLGSQAAPLQPGPQAAAFSDVSKPVPEPSQAVPSKPDPALVEAVVNRVLEKMRPQVVDIITKEFLRPVVQALVHREIEKQ